MCCFPTGTGLNWLVLTGPGLPALNTVLTPLRYAMGQLPRRLKDLRCNPLGCHILAPSDWMHSDYDSVVGFLGYLSAIFFFIEYVATYTMGCSLLPPVWHACHCPGGPALNKVNDLSTRDVATRCSTCFL